jgi:hypothetical protein
MDEDGPRIITRSAAQRCGPNLGHSGLLLDEDGPRIITRSGKRALADDAERKFARMTSIDASDTGTDEGAESASDAGSGSTEA